METQTKQEQTTGFKFNYSNKERALKELQTEQAFKDLNIEVYK